MQGDWFAESVAQSVRASACGAEGRGFETRHSPFYKTLYRTHPPNFRNWEGVVFFHYRCCLLSYIHSPLVESRNCAYPSQRVIRWVLPFLG